MERGFNQRLLEAAASNGKLLNSFFLGSKKTKKPTSFKKILGWFALAILNFYILF